MPKQHRTINFIKYPGVINIPVFYDTYMSRVDQFNNIELLLLWLVYWTIQYFYLMVFEWGFNIMMSDLPIWWSTAIAVAVFGKVFMSLLCIDLYVNTQLLWLLLLEHSNSSNCVWNNITGIAVYWLICQTQLLWLLLLKHSNSSSYVW